MAVYRGDDRVQRFTLKMLEKMDTEQLLEEARKICKGKD
jgi:hypothetical protein